MVRVTTWGSPAVARWRALPLERQLHWLLRLGVIGCFIGHGAYGFITKEAWVPFFGVVGMDRTWAYRLMPWVGAMDVSLGVIMAVVPLRIVLLHLTIWGLWTAVLRPLSGDSMWEFLERAGNYGVPLAFLILAGVPRCWRDWFMPAWPSAMALLTVDRARRMHGICASRPACCCSVMAPLAPSTTSRWQASAFLPMHGSCPVSRRSQS